MQAENRSQKGSPALTTGEIRRFTTDQKGTSMKTLRAGLTALLGATMLLVALSMFGVFFYVSLFMQQILNYSPVKAGVAFLPMTLCIILFAPIAGRLSDRIGSRWLMSGGLCLVSLSLVLFGLLDQYSDFWNLVPALVVGGIGMAMAMTPTASAAMGSVPAG